MDSISNENNSGQEIVPSLVIKNKSVQMAQLNLNNLNKQNEGHMKIRQVQISCKEDNTVNLAKMNLIRIAYEINKIYGEVEHIEHHRSGILLIKTKDYQQVEKLLAISLFLERPLPVVVSKDWGSVTVQGKIYAL